MAGQLIGASCFFVAKKISPALAEERMRARGFTPDGPYPGAVAPWPGTCDRCGASCAPRYANVVTAGQGPCRACSGSAKRTEQEARAILAQRGLEATEPYKGVNTPWKARCLTCGGTTAPTLSSVRKALAQRQGFGCDLCRRNGPIRPEDATDMLRAAGAEPLVPFPGVKKPWPSRCLNLHCRRAIKPVFDSIKHARTGACRYCGGYGIRAGDAALLYLLHHDTLAAAKIGIAKEGGDRLAEHARTGWRPILAVHMLGHQARAVENAVLDLWRRELALPYGARAEDMPFAGYTETVRLADRPLEQARVDVLHAIERGHGTPEDAGARPTDRKAGLLSGSRCPTGKG